MRVMYLGSLSAFHAENILRMFLEAGYDLSAANTSHRFDSGNLFDLSGLIPIYQAMPATSAPLSRLGRWRRLLQITAGTLSQQSISHEVLQAVEKHQPDMIFASWGPQLTSYIRALKILFPDLPVVHEVHCFPTSAPTAGVFPDPTMGRLNYRVRWMWRRLKSVVYQHAQLRHYGSVVRQLSGRLDSCQTMKRYIDKLYNLEGQSNLIWMERLSKRYFYQKRLPLLSRYDGKPHLVFLGRTDFLYSPMDDVRYQLKAIADKGIHIHMADGGEVLPESPYMHFFKKFPVADLVNGSLATFCTQFDACIVLSNVDKHSARFHNTLPTRFLFAFPAGIPIVLPQGYFKGCQEVVEDLKIGFAYDNLAHLTALLTDGVFMRDLQQRTVETMNEQTFEQQFSTLDQFLQKVVAL